MTQPKTDPRVLRTRTLIMESFIELSGKKEFKDITIKDITTEAMINRATFYYHFEDKYDLLDKALSELLSINLDSRNFDNSKLNEDTIINLFKGVTNFQKSLPNRCQVGYEDEIAPIIREQLEIIFYKLLINQHTTDDKQVLKVTAVLLSWGIYGASVEWRRNSQQISPEEFIKSAVPYIISGIDFNLEK
ncbi:TetR/AcrR family transcriptional regulator [Cytobacillus firmus]|uniref:TetR/AcrR family transcriptional regulator n=1 Tax=Cytobacillus firmus TaxID=1399 RepID=UPI0018CF3BBE|nr:TetR/AcrR family transcriptional regulator [Cytobacillus firmus]MBG9547808.1 TetR family transcriptional regulator [Cytobacillus firmus]MBG9600694.1 TetR family transcriptional regulator [Cytobacillus firmus]MBG9656029.1 TetR family transcriptional regulator [Cytobacillus firmus]MDD9311432.1 TetR/AcrR family transcriptional regulator [Cytobacillus firmus]MED1909080.1 TetR/AcrR family transcriptional regulator [Cytobacillus firmus]